MERTAELLGDERRERILGWLASEGMVRASDLADRLDVSLDTVRRDLRDLAVAGSLRRVHGGALPASPGPSSFRARLPDDVAAKASIARRAISANLIGRGDVAALSGGTTMLEFARLLSDELRATTITSSLDVAVALADHPGLTVDVIGGRLHPQARTMVGADAVRALRDVRPDVCVLSACSLHATAGPTLRHREEAEVVRAMVDDAARVIVLATASKLGTAGPYVVADLERIDLLITDADDDDQLDVLRELGVEVLRA
jgi:DeoR/GlpR family transcriptional regulator of sugar metabolism